MTINKTYSELNGLREEIHSLTSEGDSVITLEDWKWWILDQIIGKNAESDDVVPNRIVEHTYWVAETVWDYDSVPMQAVTEIRELLS